ncbi:uncharacterized protein LOC127855528 [Dreissena polymorpha]|uniref:Uncharacterized protein n=1 Tax=Dreissena polymorpha TaxID=45954 RepID=A0A9D4HGV9_DREPO|nr:uncharacterized protein LOC127855528 [Dreissena polymorpha]KAH3716928.1 hypothetical protein DPMN_059662 [Dreissena polymorpha]
MVRYIACFTFLVAYLFVVPMDAWRGNLAPYIKEVVSECRLCLCQYPWGCSLWGWFKCTVWETKQRCANGYEHNGNYICDKPICSPRCLNGGRCIEPNKCRCNDDAIGPFCGTELCSRNHPCYPGDCYENSKCNCTEGFDKTTTNRLPSDPGCMKIANNNKPFIGRSTTKISHFRNTTEELLYFFQLDATDEDPQKRVVWSNQQVFNYLSFQFEARYVEPQTMPERPTYVHGFKYGIVGGEVEVNVFDLKKESAGQRGTYIYRCPGISVSNPTQLMNCSIPDKPFKTLIEHGDTMEVTLTAYSGGQRKIVLPEGDVRTENIIGTEYTKQMEFKFDFEPAVHCSKNSTFTCQPNANVLKATPEFTKTPIVLEWEGWVDTDQYSAGVGAYRLELHRLEVKDATLELTEANPTLPLLENRVDHTKNTMGQNLFRTTFTPPEPGMYSIVMEVTDNANNSIFTRRFALYDNVSSVTTNPLSAHGLHATSGAKETGYRWQMETKSVKLNWTDYFVNKVHHEKKFLNKIKKFPTLFDDLESIGIRNVKKFVFDSYDDTEGNRTMDAIPNVNGITRFEYGYVVNQASEQAPTVWNTGLTQNVDLPVSTNHGDTVTLWVRAFDILGNMLEKKTTVTIDVTPPEIVSNLAENKTSSFTPNAGKTDGGYYYSSYEFYARDKESGVYQIELDVNITMADIGEVRRFQQVVNGSMDKTKSPSDSACVPSKDPVTCFLERQNVRLDNCWFLVPKKDYSIKAGATVTVRAFNQARQPVNTTFEIKRLNSLKGLEIYSGPENIRITNKRPDSFRIQWDLPTVRSCYDSQPIVINISFSDDTQPKKYYLTSTTTFLDVAGLTPNTVYKISFYTQLGSETDDVSEAFAQKSVQTASGFAVKAAPNCKLTVTFQGQEIPDGGFVRATRGRLNKVYCSAICTGPGTSPALQFSTKDNLISTLTSKRIYSVRSTHDRNATLNVQNMVESDEGVYYCKWRINGGGWRVRSFSLVFACPNTHMLCDNTKCIMKKDVCNGVEDCEDKKDETECATSDRVTLQPEEVNSIQPVIVTEQHHHGGDAEHHTPAHHENTTEDPHPRVEDGSKHHATKHHGESGHHADNTTHEHHHESGHHEDNVTDKHHNADHHHHHDHHHDEDHHSSDSKHHHSRSKHHDSHSKSHDSSSKSHDSRSNHHDPRSKHHDSRKQSHDSSSKSHDSSSKSHDLCAKRHVSKFDHHDSKSDHHDSHSKHHDSSSKHHDSKSDHHDSNSDHHDSKSDHHDSRSRHHDSHSKHHDSKSDHHDSKSDHHDSKSDYQDSRSKHHDSHSKHHDSKSDHHDSKSDHYDSRSKHHDSRSKHHDSQTDHHDSKSDHHDSKSDHHDSHAKSKHHDDKASPGHSSVHNGNVDVNIDVEINN